MATLLFPVLLRFSTDPLSPKLIYFFFVTASEPPKPDTLEVAPPYFIADPNGAFLSVSLSRDS